MIEALEIVRGPQTAEDEVAAAVAALAAGEPIVLVDDEGAHLVLGAARASGAAIATLAAYGYGVLKVAVAPARLAALGFGGLAGGGFHAPVDLAGGNRAGDPEARAATVRALADPSSTAADFRHPGHVFPVAAWGGPAVDSAVRAAAAELAGAATGASVAAYCGAAGERGGPADPDEAARLADALGWPLVSVDSVAVERPRLAPAVERLVAARLPTTGGEMSAVAFRSLGDGREYTAFVRGGSSPFGGTVVHVQFGCQPGEVFGGASCDCRRVLDAALAEAGDSGQVIVVHTPHPDPLRHLGAAAPAPTPAIERDLAHLLRLLGVRGATVTCNEDIDFDRFHECE
jgi:3,4-dihydroxy 2-butanone 4-phosphate synthase/GTP cyclohydrolase II